MKRRAVITAAAVAGILVPATAFHFSLPKDLFKDIPYSTVVTDRSGALLGARIAEDGQWRFPPCDSVPTRYAEAVIEFEDRYFRYMPGVNPFALCRALRDNLRAGRITSGGSTLSMQVIRLSRRRERNLRQKIIEIILALRLELRCSKDEILALYASHAPFGGNVVGIGAAAWRYFGRPPSELSWGEAAMLAVLPNSPSDIHISRNREALKAKRNRLLLRLRDRGRMTASDCALACEEELPEAPLPLPGYASHLVEWYWKHCRGRQIRTGIDLQLQKQVESVAARRNEELSRTGIADLAAVVLSVHTGEILAYCGNAAPERKRPGSEVDILRSPRSTGSILKPLLYCACLQDGELLPHTLLADIPVNINGFSPQNFNRKFSGAVKASEALTRSLNVPSVRMLRSYGVPKFRELLKKAGMTTLNRSADDYGLSLILGGAEGRLLEITGMYAEMSRQYQSLEPTGFPLKDKCALWHTFEALKEVNRPDEIDWRLLRSVRKIAWKTGTSYGFRDAWAVGVNPDYAVGVWAGNAQGQGVPGLTGAAAAGPVLFDIFNLLRSPAASYGPPAGASSEKEAAGGRGSARRKSRRRIGEADLLSRPGQSGEERDGFRQGAAEEHGSARKKSRRRTSEADLLSRPGQSGEGEGGFRQKAAGKSGVAVRIASRKRREEEPVPATWNGKRVCLRGNGAYAADDWFLPPAPKDYVLLEVCRESGMLKGPYCELTDTLPLPKKAVSTAPCPYHRLVNGEIVFLLPPAMEWYYRQEHPEYRRFEGGSAGGQAALMEFIYPEAGSRIHLPKQLDGRTGEVTFRLAHRNPDTVVYWHLDREYLGETRYLHQLNLQPPKGRHTVTVVDSHGNSLSVGFVVE